jgi:hypothetical protein
MSIALFIFVFVWISVRGQRLSPNGGPSAMPAMLSADPFLALAGTGWFYSVMSMCERFSSFERCSVPLETEER